MSANKKVRIATASSVGAQQSAESGWALDDVMVNRRLGTGDGGARATHPGEVVRSLFGNTANITQTLSHDLDLRESTNHATTGIPYAIHGTATLVQQRVAAALATYQDPIKAVLPTVANNSKRIVIRRKYVVGGDAIITPERAPARTVAIREDERSVVLTRYGGDLEMNLNLFLRPKDAKEEFDMKLAAQTRELEYTLVELGYNMLMEQGTQLVPALVRMMPQQTLSDGSIDNHAAMAAANQVYTNRVFGCMQKNRYPFQNMMAAAKMAGLYMPAANGGYDTCILPSGLLEMERVTKRENMEYYLTGTGENDRQQVNVKLENVYADKRVPGMRIMIHQPKPNFDHGAAYPTMDGSCLSRTISMGMIYQYENGTAAPQQIRIPDYANNTWKIITVGNGNRVTYIQPNLKVRAASAILAVSGSNTGELLYAYPSTGISTSQTTEQLKMQLRVYMGAVLYDPTRVLVLPDVDIEGIVAAPRLAEVPPTTEMIPMDSIDFAAVAAHMGRYENRTDKYGRAVNGGGAYTADNTGAGFDQAIQDYYGLAAEPNIAVRMLGPSRAADTAVAAAAVVGATAVNVAAAVQAIVGAGAPGATAGADVNATVAAARAGADAAASLENRKVMDFMRLDTFANRSAAATSFDDAEEPLVFYKGRVELLTAEGGWKEVVPNTGHLGHLDCPGLCGRSGQMGVFSERP
jgi:hypothetical protein